MKSVRNTHLLKRSILPCLWVFLVLTLCFGQVVKAATFSGNGQVTVADPSGALSWNSSGMTVSCWMKLSIPSETVLSENMTALVNRTSGTDADNQAFQIRFNINTGNLEFYTKGTSGSYTNVLIERPYLERWYHIAVTRQNDDFHGYVDGRETFHSTGNVGSSANADGVSVGGFSNGKFLFGEVQEVAIYQEVLSQDFITQYMFLDQPAQPTLKGYLKLAFSTNTTDQLKNFAPAPVPNGTESASTTGPVTFDETNQAGEQSTFDSRRNGGRDAMTPLSGSFSWQQTGIARPTPGVAFEFGFGYSSANTFGGFKLGSSDPYASSAMGSGWRHTFETRLVPGQIFSPIGGVDVLGLMNWDGAIEAWVSQPDSDSYLPRSGEYKGELRLIGSTACEWTTPDRQVYRYKHPFAGSLVMRGRLTEIRDFQTNRIQILYNETTGVVTQILDSVRGRFDLAYTNNLLKSVQFQDWQLNFAYDATNRLVSKTLTNASGMYTNVEASWQFLYHGTNGLLDRIIDPRGYTNIVVQYDQYGRKTNEVDALGRATGTRYGVPGKRQVSRWDPAKNVWIETYDRKGRITAQRDPLGNQTSYTYDDQGNRISITDPLGNKSLFAYDTRANVVISTNALNEVTRWTFHTFFNKPIEEVNPLGWTNRYQLDDATGNILRHSDDLGTLVQYLYSTNGLLLTNIDANANITRFRYDTNGFLTARIDSAGFTNSFALNELGWKVAETNALGYVSTFSYNLNGNVVRSVDPLQRLLLNVFDPNGNLTTNIDAKSQVTTYAYDAANQRTNMVDRTRTNIWQFLFNSRGKLDRTIDSLRNSVSNSYDAASRLISVTDPLGNSITNNYDAAGNLISMIDQERRVWQKTYDRLNRVVLETDPEQNSRKTAFDSAGRIKQVTTPNGYSTLNDYDGRGRLAIWTDAEGFVWRYTYDGNANITDIEDALHGHYVMTYGPRNERLTERNQDAKEWVYTYDPLLRLQSQHDPNGISRSLVYDRGGRVDSITFSTGRVNSFGYDDNNNPTVLSRSGSGPATLSQLVYDARDRVTEYTDAFSKKVRYGYDGLGRVVSLMYPDGKVLRNGFDALGRLTNQVFNAQFTNGYAYDRAGRLAQHSYPNGILQTNTFDASGRLTGLSYLTNAANPASALIALAYAYDHNGNKVASSEKGTLDWPIPTLTTETTSFTPAGRMMQRQVAQSTPQGTPTNAYTVTYQYDASGNMTNAGGGGQSWSLTYDEDNRVTSVFWQVPPLADKLITNRYDALGRRVARIADGTETRFVLDLVGGMERTLCDVDGSGAIRAWYVHGPELAFKVDDAGHLLCYHADAMANIIALTDVGATNVAQYAYTPYGKTLGPTTGNSYTFVGSQGVTEELPGLYFMRARYYSSDTGAFLSTDPVKTIGPTWQPVPYTYGQGNPNEFTDPAGTMPPQIAAAIIGGIAGSASVVISELLQHQELDLAEIAGGGVSGAVRGFVLTSTLSPTLAAGLGDASGELTREFVSDFMDDHRIDSRPDFGKILKAGLYGAGTEFLLGGIKHINVANTGNIYFGDSRGPLPTHLDSILTSSRLRNEALNDVFRAPVEAGIQSSFDQIVSKTVDASKQPQQPNKSPSKVQQTAQVNANSNGVTKSVVTFASNVKQSINNVISTIKSFFTGSKKK